MATTRQKRQRVPNPVLRAIRESERGETREQFAAAMAEAAARLDQNVACTARAVARFEDGDVLHPQSGYRRVLEAVTGRPFAELGFLAAPLASPVARRPTRAAKDDITDGWSHEAIIRVLAQITEEDPMRRRDFFAVLNGLVLVDLGREWERAPVVRLAEFTASDTSQNIPLDVVHSIEAITEHVQELDGHCDSKILLSAVQAQLRVVTELLKKGKYAETTGRRLHRTTAELLRMSGWHSFDMGHYGPAKRYLTTGLRAANAARDKPMGMHILSYMAVVEAWTGTPDDAVNLMASATREATSAPPIVNSIMAARSAMAYARVRDRSRCESSLEQSRTLFENSAADEIPSWSRYFDEALAVSRAGHCSLDLGDAALAEERFALALALRQNPNARDQSIWSSRLAIARLRQGDVDAALATGQEAIRLAGCAPSARSVEHVGQLLRELRPRMPDGRVQELRDLARTVLSPQ